jgi:hypothetical protein
VKPEKHIPNIMKAVRLKASADLDARVHRDIDRALAQTQQTLTVPREPSARRTFMRSPIFKLAIAAVVVIATGVVVLPMLGGKVVIADVIKPILNARTVAFDFMLGEAPGSVVIHDIVSGHRIRRTMSNMPMTMILDVDSGKMLTLEAQGKTALIVDIQGQVQQGTENILKLVRDIVQKIADHPQDVQDLGERKIDGRNTVGFLIKNPTEELHIWADLKTATPVRIELHGKQSMVIVRNIEFDIAVDGSLLSMEIPAGYTVKEADVKMGNFTEEDLIVGLRAWAQVVNDGKFPDTVSAAACMEQLPMLQEKMGRMNLTPDEGMKLGMGYGKLSGYLMILDYQGQWHYAGKGVTFGDAGKAVFWYRLGDAKTYRVIYGDLRVEDVELDHLPK